MGGVVCRSDLNDPQTAVMWDCEEIEGGFVCRLDLNEPQTAVLWDCEEERGVPFF